MIGHYTVIRGDITSLTVNAIVNPTDTRFSGGGTLDKLIHDKASRAKMRKACNKLGGIKTSQAKLTSGFNLPAKYVIQTVGPRWHGGNSGELNALSNCYLNCLKVASKNNIKSIAFPSISTGAFHFPTSVASRIATMAIKKYLSNHDLSVFMVCYDNGTFHYYKMLQN